MIEVQKEKYKFITKKHSYLTGVLLLSFVVLCPLFSKGTTHKTLLIKDSIDWVNQFMLDVIKLQKQRRDVVFTKETYIKNRLILDQGPKRMFGKTINYYSNINTNQLVWLNESYSQLHFSKKDGYKERVNATKSYGKYPSWEFKSAAQLSLNFSENFIKFESLSDKNFVSPLAQNAFNFYDYRLIAKDNEKVVIQVIPKHRFSPTFEGQLTFNINSCQLAHLDLKINGDKGINFIDSLQVVQEYPKDSTVPTYTLLKYKGGVLKFYFSGSSQAVFTDEKSPSEFYQDFRKQEVVKDDSSAYRSRLLKANRKIPLTVQERLASEYQDSINRQRKRNPIIDSLERLNSRVGILPLLFTEKEWTNEKRGLAIVFDPIAPAFFFNTVEGFGVNYGVSFLKFAKNNTSWSVTPRLRYGFGNQELNSDLSASWYYKPKKRGTLNFSIGSTYLDLNPNGSLTTLQNTLNTLFFEQNFMKLYRKEYISAGIGRELVGNLYLSFGAEVSKNYSVSNTQGFVFRDIKYRNYSSNNPIDPALEDKLFPAYTSFFINSSLIYTLKQPYITKDKIKIYKLPLGPRFVFSYKRGIPNMFHSTSDYNYVELEIQHEKLDMGLWGYGSYSVSAGKFINRKTAYYPEWRHFSGNLALIFNPSLRSFHLLDFYTYSTDQYFFEGHFEHNFNQYFSNRVPQLRKLKLQELVGGGYLYQPEKGNYLEVYVGLKRLFFRADYAVSFNDSGLLNHGFKISYNF
ncbi:DUF5686 family protein [Pedobacter arcticus]|uniref:DUF5686 family protein n=1 Tax=Pedobacter arcticus TaxID=752140 RepID=UPI0002D2B7D9|nr:DUF5686 family protein [Pedobacter arcticus]